MKCYTISEDAYDGLRLFADTETMEPKLTIGEVEKTVIDLSKRQTASFREAVNDPEAGKRGLRPYRVGDKMLYRIDVGRTDISERRNVLIPEQKQSQTALVHVETHAGIGGRLWYEGGVIGDRIVQGRVEPIFGVFPTTGIEVLALGTGSQGEPHCLMTMLPGAQFRILRDGDIPAGVHQSPVLIVRWTGFELHCRPPRRFQRDAA